VPALAEDEALFSGKIFLAAYIGENGEE